MFLLVFGDAEICTKDLVLHTTRFDRLFFVEELVALPAGDLFADGQLWVSIQRPVIYNVY